MSLVPKISIKKWNTDQAPMAHTCNPSYTGGRDQEDCKTLSWKNPPQKRADGVVQGVGPEFKPQYHKKKKKKKWYGPVC
jgi:hypothetical protein